MVVLLFRTLHLILFLYTVKLKVFTNNAPTIDKTSHLKSELSNFCKIEEELNQLLNYFVYVRGEL